MGELVRHMIARRYRSNPKHKRGSSGEGPPRWFPSRDSLCPDDLSTEVAQELLGEGLEGRDLAHPDCRALFALHEGVFYKAYCEGLEVDITGMEVEIWHGYPVRRELVPRQVPCRILRGFVRSGRLTRSEYKKLVGDAK